MPGFDYEITAGVHILWIVTVSPADILEGIDGSDLESCDSLTEVEQLIEDFEGEWSDNNLTETLKRVRGQHGWREFVWSSGAVHRYEWKHGELDLRCATCRSVDNDIYVVNDELWASSGLDGYTCFRCLEKAIGRRLTSADFKPDLPANDDRCHHCPDLRQRIGLT